MILYSFLENECSRFQLNDGYVTAGVIGLGLVFHRAGIESIALNLIELGTVPFLFGTFIKVVMAARYSFAELANCIAS